MSGCEKKLMLGRAKPNDGGDGVAIAPSSSSSSSSCKTCSTCDGPVPWVETNPHAHEANGKICIECGHFYGIPAFEGTERDFGWSDDPESLLRKYLMECDWEKAMIRLKYVPEEATYYYASYARDTCLVRAMRLWTTWNGHDDNDNDAAPIPLIRALANAWPDAIRTPRNLFWHALSVYPFSSKRLMDIVTVFVNADITILQTTPGRGGYRKFSDHWSTFFGGSIFYQDRFQEAADYDSVKDEVLESYTDPYEAIEKGDLRQIFNLFSRIVKWDAYGNQISTTELDNKPLLHAIAACRDPQFNHVGLPLLGIKLFPQQLVQKDATTGNCPLHIAASTINRDMKEYYSDQEWSTQHQFEEDKHILDKKSVIESFIKAAPSVASYANNAGQLPIHLAVGMGKKRWLGGVREIAEAFPEGVGLKDPQTNLYPFMACATSEDDLDTCYELLRFRPEVVTWGLDNKASQQAAIKKKNHSESTSKSTASTTQVAGKRKRVDS